MWFLLKIFQVAKGNVEGLDLKKPQLQTTTNEIKAKQDTNPPENTVLPTSWYILYICTAQSLILKQTSFHIISLGETIPKLHYMAVIFRFISLLVM